MNLEWIEKLGFLSPDPDSGVYLKFPIPVRKTIALQTVTFLLKDTTDLSKVLTSQKNVETVMEAMGQAFSLTMEDLDVIEPVLECYSKWLLKSPSPFDQNLSYFVRKSFRHLSQLFEPRHSGVETQIQLCSKVLSVMEHCISKDNSSLLENLDSTTWDTMLKVVVGCADRLLKAPENEANALSNKLTSQLLKVTIQMLLRSGTMNVGLWKTLTALVRGWRHRLTFVSLWSAILNAFTKRILRILYGSIGGLETVILELDGSRYSFTLSHEFTIYCWGRFLHCLGDFESFDSPQCYIEAIKGLGSLVDLFIGVSQRLNETPVTEKPSSKAPDGNTILHLVGSYLFESANLYENIGEFERGKAQAFSILCKIFREKYIDTNFSSIHLSCFYRGIQEGLKRGNFIMSTIITNCTWVFSSNLPGTTVLIQNFLSPFETILLASKPLEGINSSWSNLRNSCYKIIGSWVCLPAHFGSIPLSKNSKETFSQLSEKIAVLLLEAIQREEDSVNRDYLLQIAWVFLRANVVHSQFPIIRSTCNSLALVLLSKLGDNLWPNEDLLIALLFLSNLAQIQIYIHQVHKETGSNVVNKLCLFIKNLLESKRPQPLYELLIVRSFQAISDWIFIEPRTPWILSHHSTLKQIFEVIEIGLMVNKGREGAIQKRKSVEISPDRKISKTISGEFSIYLPSGVNNIKEASNLLLKNLLCIYYNSSKEKDSSYFKSSVGNEFDILKKYKIPKSNVQCYALNQSILSVIRHSDPKETCKVTIVLRNETGKFIWDAHLLWNEQSYVPPNDVGKMDDTPSKVFPAQPIDEEVLLSLQSFFSEKDKTIFKDISKATKECIAKEQAFLKTKGYGRNVNIECKRPSSISLDSNDPTPTRLFRALMGHLSVNFYDQIDCFEKFNASRFAFDNFLPIDEISERETVQIGVLYVDDYFEDAILKCNGGNKEFNDFLVGLGTFVDLAYHSGFRGDLSNSGVAPYYSNYKYEIIFACTTLIPPTDIATTQLKKRQIINNCPVLIMWVTDIELLSKLDIHKNHRFSLIIVPIKSHKLFQIRIFESHPSTDTPSPFIGSKLDKMIVNNSILPSLIRDLALNAVQTILSHKPPPYFRRRQLIEELVAKHRIPEPFHNFLASAFLPKKET